MSDRLRMVDDSDDPGRSGTGRLSAGGSSKLARLFEEHNASLVSLLRARLHSEQEARDVAQEAYVRLLQLDQLGTVSYLRAYLFRTALNIATDRLRAGAIRTAAHRDPVFDARADERSPEDVVSAREGLSAVEAALRGLPAHVRYAFLLHRFADVPAEEVARRLGVTRRTVHNYMVTALLACRAALNEPPGDSSRSDSLNGAVGGGQEVDRER